MSTRCAGRPNKSHSNNKNNQQQEERRNGKNELICYNCNQVGHKQKDCKSPRTVHIQEVTEDEGTNLPFLGQRALLGPQEGDQEDQEW